MEGLQLILGSMSAAVHRSGVIGVGCVVIVPVEVCGNAIARIDLIIDFSKCQIVNAGARVSAHQRLEIAISGRAQSHGDLRGTGKWKSRAADVRDGEDLARTVVGEKVEQLIL
jgi:hypothetical protein